MRSVFRICEIVHAHVRLVDFRLEGRESFKSKLATSDGIRDFYSVLWWPVGAIVKIEKYKKIVKKKSETLFSN